MNVLSTVAHNKRLLAVNRALLQIIALNKFIQKNSTAVAKKHANLVRVLLDNLQKTSCILGFRKTLKWCNISYAKFLVLKKTLLCTSSPIHRCRRKHPGQLLRSETDKIVATCNDEAYSAWPLASIYHNALRKKIFSCSLSTFYKYVSILVNRQSLPQNRRKNHFTGIRASNPLQIIHADITQFVTEDNKKAYIYFIQDNFSRAILQYKIAGERKAIHTIELIRKAYNDLKNETSDDCTIITDDGCENKGISEYFIHKSFPSLVHLVAQKDISFSNSMIEHLNKTIKYRYLYQQPVADIKALEIILATTVNDYNNRPVHVLNGLTPREALQNQKLNSEILTEQIKLAAINRKLKNKSDDCCLYL